jgi:hypothetical protein
MPPPLYWPPELVLSVLAPLLDWARAGAAPIASRIALAVRNDFMVRLLRQGSHWL